MGGCYFSEAQKNRGQTITFLQSSLHVAWPSSFFSTILFCNYISPQPSGSPVKTILCAQLCIAMQNSRSSLVPSLSRFFDDLMDIGNLISGSSAFFKSSLNICNFMVHLLLSLAWRILSITLLEYEMSATVQQFEDFLALPFFGIGIKTDLFQSCGHY